jgi:putative transposase
MWTAESRALVGDVGAGQALGDEQYALLAPMIPPAKPGGRPAAHDRHAADAGRLVPPRAHRLPPVAPPAAPSRFPALADGVRRYMRAFADADLWETIRHHPVMMLRERDGREPSPTAAILDTQSVKTTEKGGLAATTRPRSSRAASGTSRSTPRACCWA